jgi:hypothetical protein
MDHDARDGDRDATPVELGVRGALRRSHGMLIALAVLGIACCVVGWWNVASASDANLSNGVMVRVMVITIWLLAVVGTLLLLISTIMLLVLRRAQRAALIGPDGLVLRTGADQVSVPWPHVDRVVVRHRRTTSPVFADLSVREGSPLLTPGMEAVQRGLRRAGSQVDGTFNTWIGDLTGAALPPEQVEAALRRWAGDRFRGALHGS